MPPTWVYSSSSSSYDGPQLILFGIDVGTVLPWHTGLSDSALFGFWSGWPESG